MEEHERIHSIGPAGVMATACKQKWIRRNTGSPGGDRSNDQLTTRESQVGPYGVAERFVVRAEQDTAKAELEPLLAVLRRAGCPSSEYRKMESEGHEDKYRAVIDGETQAGQAS
jgi:hypothetical protein